MGAQWIFNINKLQILFIKNQLELEEQWFQNQIDMAGISKEEINSSEEIKCILRKNLLENINKNNLYYLIDEFIHI